MDSVLIDPDISLGDYIALYWLPIMRKRVEPETLRSYEIYARVHIPPELMALPIRSIRRGQLKRLLAGLGEAHHLAEATVASVANVVRSIFASALDDEVIAVNPAEKICRVLGLRPFYVENVKAMDAHQLRMFLTVARIKEPTHHLELATIAFTGLRIGEARGLQIGDVDLPGHTIMVQRQIHEDGSITGPKGRRGRRKTRTVDLADELAELLAPALAARREYDMRMRRRSLWLFYPEFSAQPTGTQVATVTRRLRRAMVRVLQEAKIPDFHTPHHLRHTFARLLLERGEDLLYVARQLGDTLPITAEIYGRWARVPSRAGGTNLLSMKRPNGA